MNFEKMVNITRAPSEECTDETDSQMRGITNGRDTPQILQAEEKKQQKLPRTSREGGAWQRSANDEREQTLPARLGTLRIRRTQERI